MTKIVKGSVRKMYGQWSAIECVYF